MRTALVQQDRYSRGAVLFHWTIAVLVIVNLLIGLFHESLFKGVATAMPLHKSIGLTVLVLSIGRLAWRLAHRPPPLPIETPGWERLAAKATHWVFYALISILPLTGWMMSSGAKRYPLKWFTLFDVPYLPISPALAKDGANLHGLLGYVMTALVLLHVGAALRHHYIKRDSVLARMVPGLMPRG